MRTSPLLHPLTKPSGLSGSYLIFNRSFVLDCSSSWWEPVAHTAFSLGVCMFVCLHTHMCVCGRGGGNMAHALHCAVYLQGHLSHTPLGSWYYYLLLTKLGHSSDGSLLLPSLGQSIW